MAEIKSDASWQHSRETFRHGNLPEALVEAALRHLESEGPTSLSLRELARDVGVNHRAVYRHFPDKLSLLARVAEEGWRRLGRRMGEEADDRKSGEEMIVASGVAFFQFARENPNLFHLMAGPRLNTQGRFPSLDREIVEALKIIQRGFSASGTAPELTRSRTAIFAAALQGVTVQSLHRRLRVSPGNAETFMAETCKMLIKGLR